jgi:predicted heme/steroid binding protein
MKRALFFWLCLLLLAANQLPAQTPLISYGSTWKYLDNGTDQGIAWRSLSFNDGSWKTGNGLFGYGISGLTTTISFGPDPKKKYITTYFRKTISLTDPANFTAFSAGVKRDDGVVVYVNGVEVYRNLLPTGSINYLTFGKDASDNGTVTQPFTINKSAFVSGNNVIAVEIHQKTTNNADLAFDLQLSGILDQSSPSVVSILRQSPTTQLTNASTVIFRATFSEKVRGVDISDFTLNTIAGTANGVLENGAIAPVSTDSIAYNITISSVQGDGTLRLDLNASGTGITDIAGNAISTGFTTGDTYIVDNTVPLAVSILRQSPTTQTTNASSVIFRTTFSESVTGVNNTDFTLTTISGAAGGVLATGAVVPVGTNGTTYDVTVSSVQGDGTLRLDLNGSGTGINDAAGNAISTGFTNGETYIIKELTPPVVTGIQRQTPTTQLTNASTIIFRATFSEKVSGVDNADFTLTTVAGTASGILANDAVAPVDTDSIAYDITVSTVQGNGTLRLDLNGSGTGITDTAGNAISTGFTTGDTYIVDNTAPLAVSILRQSPTTQTTNASSVIFRTTFSESVTGVNNTDFTLTTVSGTAGGVLATGAVVPVGTNGTTYDVTVSSVQGDGTLRLDLNGSGTGINDAVGNAISTGFTNGETYIIQQQMVTPPVVTGITRQSPSTQLTNASTIIFRATFSMKVRGVDNADFTLTTVAGTASGILANGAVTPVGTDSIAYDITVITVQGNGTLRLDLNGSGTGITDTAGNAISAGFTNGDTYIVDNTAPLAVSILRQSPTTQTTNASSVIFRATFSEKVTGVNNTDFTLTTVSGTAGGVLATGAVVPVGTNGTTYDVTVSSVQGDGTLRLDLNGSGTGITDSVGNAIGTGFTNGETYIIQQQVPEGPPIVTSVNRQMPANEQTDVTEVTYRVIFSEKVRGVDAADFIIFTQSGNARGTLTKVAPQAISTSLPDAVQVVDTDSTTYDVTLKALAGSGVLRLDVKGTNTGITDAAGNALNGGFTNGQTYTVNISLSQGFQSFVDLDPLTISSATREIPQTKVWHYSGKWWAVAATSAGTKILRLDNTSWTDVLTIATATNSRADCRVVGNLVHLVLFRGASSTSYFVSLEYDAANNTYKRWTQRTSNVNIVFESGTVTATLDVDATGRAWLASNSNGNMLVRWSDAPYATWSAPITIATGAIGEDICTITALPGKIGIFWSNQNTKRFGFKTHTDGADATIWSADEVPAGQSALNEGTGMADDHLNIVPASDGTLYCAIKTGYNKDGLPTIALLVRRPNNTWDNLYPVTSSKEGNRPIVVLNEAAGKVKVMYSTHNVNFDGTRSGDILYRESSTSAISFGPPVTLMSGAGTYSLQYTTSAHQTYEPAIVVWATNESVSPLKAVGVLATDAGAPAILTRSSATPALIPFFNHPFVLQTKME